MYSGCAAYVSMLCLVGCHGSMRMPRKKAHSRVATPTTIITTTMGPPPAPTKGRRLPRPQRARRGGEASRSGSPSSQRSTSVRGEVLPPLGHSEANGGHSSTARLARREKTGASPNPSVRPLPGCLRSRRGCWLRVLGLHLGSCCCGDYASTRSTVYTPSRESFCLYEGAVEPAGLSPVSW